MSTMTMSENVSNQRNDSYRVKNQGVYKNGKDTKRKG
jgi:hypothetical protein